MKYNENHIDFQALQNWLLSTNLSDSKTNIKYEFFFFISP